MKFFVAAAAMVAAVAAAPAPEAEAWGTGHCATASATRTASYIHYSYSPTATTHKHEGRRSRLRARPRRRLSAGGTEGGEHPCGVRPDPLQPSLLQRQQLRVRPAAQIPFNPAFYSGNSFVYGQQPRSPSTQPSTAATASCTA